MPATKTATPATQTAPKPTKPADTTRPYRTRHAPTPAAALYSPPSSARMRYTVARETPSAAAIVVTGSPEACIRQASFALEASRALGRPICLAACATGLTGCCAPLTSQFQLKFREARQNAGYHPARRIGGVDSFAQRAEHDVTFTQLADGGHDFCRVAPQAVEARRKDYVSTLARRQVLPSDLRDISRSPPLWGGYRRTSRSRHRRSARRPAAGSYLILPVSLE